MTYQGMGFLSDFNTLQALLQVKQKQFPNNEYKIEQVEDEDD